MKPDWIEPEEGWNPWRVGQVMLDKRSGLVVEIVEAKQDVLEEGEDWDGSPTDRRYWGYRIVYFDDKTDPVGGCWRAPEDLKPLSEMEVIARLAL